MHERTLAPSHKTKKSLCAKQRLFISCERYYFTFTKMIARVNSASDSISASPRISAS